jgi:F-type H+-transporting ATPase subunit a
MPEHTTWWAYLPGYDEWVASLSEWLSETLGPGWGRTLMGNAIDLQHVFGALFVLLVLVLVGLYVRTAVRDIRAAVEPETRLTLRTFVEIFIEVVLGFAEDLMGRKAARALFPLIGTCAFFIFFSNFSGFIPGLAPPLMIFMVFVEGIGHMVRPMSLSIRLMGNMTADHTVAAVFLGLVPFLVPLPVMLLGVLVAVVQTLVFILLSMVYIGSAMEHHAE